MYIYIYFYTDIHAYIQAYIQMWYIYIYTYIDVGSSLRWHQARPMDPRKKAARKSIVCESTRSAWPHFRRFGAVALCEGRRACTRAEDTKPSLRTLQRSELGRPDCRNPASTKETPKKLRRTIAEDVRLELRGPSRRIVSLAQPGSLLV